MTADAVERSIQDYLDDRMTAAERQAFEQRLRAEPGLSRRLEALRELGAALREEVAEPSPEFYARARARFASGAGTDAAPRPQALPWRVAGLAAAALLAAALLWPLFHVSPPEDELRQAARVQAGATEGSAAPGEPTAGDLIAEARPPVPAETGADAPVPPPAARRERALLRDESESKRAASSAESAEDDVAAEARTARRPAANESVAGAAPAAAPAPATADEDAAASPILAVRALPRGTLVPGAVRILGQADARKSAFRSDAAKSAPAGRRTVLIGPREPGFACDDLVASAEEGGYVVRLAPTSGAAHAPGGCALELPDDGRPIEVDLQVQATP